MKNLIVLFVFLAACVSSGPKGKEQAQIKDYQLPAFEEVQLQNGARLIFLPSHELPRISLSALVQVGSVDDPKGKEGLNAMVASLLDEGTQSKSSEEISEVLDYLGASISASPGHDFTTANVVGLSHTREQLLAIFLDVLSAPAFAPQEFQRVKTQTLGAISKRQDNPSSRASELFERAIFQQHPYASPVMGGSESVKAIGLEDIKRHYRQKYVPSNMIFAVVGDFSPSFATQIKTSLGAWVGNEKKPKYNTATPKRDLVESMAGVQLNSKSGLVQSQIRIGHLGIPRQHEDFLRLRVANMILGGAFASRLNQRVRDDLGLTYSIYSSAESRGEAGVFHVSTYSRNDKVYETISETLNEINKLVDKGVSEAELSAAKNVLIGQFPGALETLERVAYNLMVLRAYGVSDDYLRSYNRTIANMSLEEVNGAIRKHIRPDALKIMVYGDKDKIFEQLKKIGPVKM